MRPKNWDDRGRGIEHEKVLQIGTWIDPSIEVFNHHKGQITPATIEWVDIPTVVQED